MSVPAEITVTLDLDSWLARYGEIINEDGDREVIPMTLEDVVIDRAAKELTGRAIKNQKSGYPTLTDRIADITREEILARVGPMIEEAIATPIRKTNSWGEATGETTTLREVIVDEARKYLNKPADNYSRDRGTVVQVFIREEVAKAVKAELAETLATAKAQVFGAVKENAAAMIAEAVRKAVAS